MNRRSVLAGLGSVWMAGCTGVALSPESSGEVVVFDAADMAIRGRYYPPSGPRPAKRLWVMIEGDGAMWPGGQPPADPTPRRAVGPAVVSILPATDARLWLARPCQFLPDGRLAACDERYWTSARFSAPVIAAYQSLVDRFAGQMQIIPVGFSGGGLIAAELALSRADVAGLITLAAPLDLAAWTTHHGVPPLAGPRPPEALLDGLSRLEIPSLHLFGGLDDVVPPAVLARVLRVLPKERVEVVPNARHGSDWAGALSRRLNLFGQTY